MKLATQTEDIKSGGLGAGNTFSIAASAKAFEVLSSNLYQNKILAVIREITCNAADAHKAAGVPLSKIVVSLPSYTAPRFSVRDFGSGLSHDDVLQLYTTYFQSTKDGSNDMIGGFGLGSKSPFAVSDQFTVTSWFNGIKSTYIMYKDAGMPHVNVISQTPSSEPSGLEVMLAVAKDIENWRTEATKFFAWWPELPDVRGVSIPRVFVPSNIVVQSPDTVDGYPAWAIFSTQDYGSAPRVFMGLVPYALNLSAVPGLPSDVNSLFSSLNMVLTFPVGALSINPSRETLSYDKTTCDKIVDALKTIAANLLKETNNALASQPTLYAARQYVFGTLNSNTTGGSKLSQIIRGKVKNAYTWKGQPVKERVDFDLKPGLFADDITIQQYGRRSWRKNWHKGSTFFYDCTHIIHNLSFAGDDWAWVWTPAITSKTYKTIAHYMDIVQTNTNSRSPNVNIVQGSTYADVCAVFEKLGLPPIEDLSTWPDPPKAVRNTNTNAAPKTTGYITTGHGNFNWDRTEQALDLTGGGIYVPFFNGNPNASINWHTYNTYVNWGWLSEKTRAIGLTKTKLKSQKLTKLLTKNGWSELTLDWIQANINETALAATALAAMFNHLTKAQTAGSNKYNELLAVLKAYNAWPNPNKKVYFAQEVLDLIPHISMTTPSGPWSYGPTAPSSHLLTFTANQTKIVADARSLAAPAMQGVEKFLDDHPMLRHTQWNSLDMATLIDYLER